MCVTGVGVGSVPYIQSESSNIIFSTLNIKWYSILGFYLHIIPCLLTLVLLITAL